MMCPLLIYSFVASYFLWVIFSSPVIGFQSVQWLFIARFIRCADSRYAYGRTATCCFDVKTYFAAYTQRAVMSSINVQKAMSKVRSQNPEHLSLTISLGSP